MSDHEHPTERTADVRPSSDLGDALRSIEATGEDAPARITPEEAPARSHDQDGDHA